VDRADHRAARVVKTVRRVLIALGALGMAYAVLGALVDPDVKVGVLVFLGAVLIAHDGILVPLTIAVGAVVGRFAPLRLRAPIRAALLVGLAVTIVAFPLVLARGRAADNPSLLPLPYGRGLLEIYGLIGLTAATAIAVRARRARRAHLQPEGCASTPDVQP
jgi:hypothetical protein